MGVGDPASERGMRVDFYFSRDGSKKPEWNVEIPHGSFETQSGLAMRSRPDHRKGDPALANDRGGAD